MVFCDTPTKEPYPGRGTLRVGDRQPEREGHWARSEGVVAQGLALSLDKPLEWAVGHGGPPHRCDVDAGTGLAGGWG